MHNSYSESSTGNSYLVMFEHEHDTKKLIKYFNLVLNQILELEDEPDTPYKKGRLSFLRDVAGGISERMDQLNG